jgi:signal transduction histidine kinase
MRPALPFAVRAVLLLFLLTSSGAVLYTTYQNTQNAVSLAVLSLQSTALALSSSAEVALRTGRTGATGEIREILSDRVVAFALIAGEDGTILFHTNAMMAGTRLPDPGLPGWLHSGVAYGRRMTLGTGLPAYEYNYILHRPGGAPELLRIVLHTAAADRIVSDARRMWWTVAGVLALLWAVGILLERLFSRHFLLAAEMEKRERLSLIGQMTASLAHEIRNALGSVKGFAQLAGEKGGTPDARNGAVSVVLQGVARIESLVNDLLLFSREETYETASLDIVPLVREALAIDTAQWTGAVELSFPPGIRVRGDREKLRRVLSNGIRNAIQAMGDGGTLRISAEEEGSRVAIRIEDTGPGIPEEGRSRLFTPFHTTKTDGTGLGLAYSKKAVEGMGGRIGLSNRKNGKGAVLSILLPSAEGTGHA